MAEGCARGAGNDGGRVEDPGAQRGATSGAGDSQDCDLEGGNGLRLSLFSHRHLAGLYKNPRNRNLQLPKTIPNLRKPNLQLSETIPNLRKPNLQLPETIPNLRKPNLQLPGTVLNPRKPNLQLPGTLPNLRKPNLQLPETLPNPRKPNLQLPGASVNLPATSALLGTRPRSHRRRVFTLGRAAASIHRADSPSSSQPSIVPTKTLRGLLADSNLNSQPPLPSPTPSASSCTPCRRA